MAANPNLTASKHKSAIMKTNIGLSDEARQAVADILNRVLADEYVLYTKTRNYHWNVVGPDFSELHKFFQEQYEALDEIIDEVAERIRAIGHHTVSSMQAFLGLTQLKESSERENARQMLENLLVDHEGLIRFLREAVDETGEEHHDAGTSDFLTGLMEQHEKMAWMLRSFVS